jgi:glycosyltransferase involved in cell wall biosynthesis
MVIDSICRGKPFLLTKHSGYAERFKDYGIIVDPLDEASMAQGIRSLADRQIYEQLRARIRAYTEVRTYDDVAREMLSIVHPQNI